MEIEDEDLNGSGEIGAVKCEVCDRHHQTERLSQCWTA